MDFDIRTKNLTLGDGAREVVVGKLTRFVRRLPSPEEASLELKLEASRDRGGRVEAQVVLSSRGTVLRAARRADDALTAVTDALSALDPQVARRRAQRHHTESIRRNRTATDREEP